MRLVITKTHDFDDNVNWDSRANFFLLSLPSYEAIHKNENLCAVETAKVLLFTLGKSLQTSTEAPPKCEFSEYLSHFIQITLFINTKIAILWACFPIANCLHYTHSSAIKKPQIYIRNGEIFFDLVRLDAVVSKKKIRIIKTCN